MESGPITSWQIDGETMETVSDFIFLGSKITMQRWLNKKPRLVTEAKFQALTGVLVAETFQ